MSLLKLLLLCLVAFPTVLAFGHDMLLFYYNTAGTFRLNNAGFFWMNINQPSLNFLKANLPPETWGSLNKILELPGVYVYGAAALVIYVISGFIAKRFEPEPTVDTPSRLSFLDDNDGTRAYKYRKKK
jgi:hypothetical protein